MTETATVDAIAELTTDGGADTNRGDEEMTQDYYPAEPALPGELLQMYQAITAIQDAARHNSGSGQSSTDIEQAWWEQRAALSASTPLTSADFQVLISHALEYLTMLAMKSKQGASEREFWLAVMTIESALLSMLKAVELLGEGKVPAKFRLAEMYCPLERVMR